MLLSSYFGNKRYKNIIRKMYVIIIKKIICEWTYHYLNLAYLFHWNINQVETYSKQWKVEKSQFIVNIQYNLH